MTLPKRWPSAAGLAVGYLADRVFGDPRRGHPVAGFGAAASWLEARCYADRQTAGVVHTAALVGAAIGLGATLERLISDRSWATVMTTAAATWAVLGGRSLSREAATVAGQLAGGKLTAARGQVRHLVGRDTAELSPEEVARATVESVAENASDAMVAPLLWGAVAGLPGLLGYRAVNTLDAMIGHRSPRYRRFGWAAARLDDLANWVPARLAALAAAAWAPLVGGTAADALGRRTPRRRPTSQPECRRCRGGVCRRARRPAWRTERVPRHGRRSRHPGQRAGRLPSLTSLGPAALLRQCR